MGRTRYWKNVLASALLLIAGGAQAQNVMILTTGGQNTSSDPENNYMPAVVNEYAAPLQFASFTSGGVSCNNVTQTTTDPVLLQAKRVTCNQSELVNGTPMAANFFDAGYDLLVVASAYTTIDAADWMVIQDAVRTRKVRGVVLYIDSINSTNRALIPNLLNASMGVTTGVGTSFGSGNFHFPRNTTATVAPYFASLER